ncbi:MAG: multi-sensor hybrid histidine kinase [Verrucomicrobiales bacterium]|nr:multi-sensor hybrid histidine kinase [Verrucomicrobiales bacterium]
MGQKSGSIYLIYVVDDKPALVDLATLVLEAAGYAVRGFQDPLEVIAAIQQGAPVPDILLPDFDMPQMNGLELIRRCRRLQPTLKTIMVSGTIDPAGMGIESTTVNRFLQKPYSPATLRDAIGQLMSGDGTPGGA